MPREGKAERDAAFAVFMEAATPSLTRTAWLLTGSAHEAAELVQATLVKTYAVWPTVRREQAVAYARRILVNQRTDTWRKGRRETLVEAPPEVGVAGGHAVEDRDELLTLLATLPEAQRKVVVLRYFSDLSERQTAEALGISVGAVKSAASRGLAALRTQLVPTEGGVR